ncbi:MFS transporter [Paenibacillus chitinolyticus]|uniref:MFS transporter n=1 Tax=Paenibacillus chitinolyticus TaxID=79263 RepID=UPI001C4933A9|nr:MFS transporter [Paenibacillus chitinolyticus]MBV6713077.1 MFS transporter [Paenibacillus chitinolyticus]
MNVSSVKTMSPTRRLVLLLLVVIISGLSQGLLLPLLTILLEQTGVSSGVNGFNAAAMYIGSFASMFVVERILFALGYKKILILGIAMETVAILLIPVWGNLTFWFILRFIIGFGNSILHYTTQLWILTSAPPERRGRYISYYGMAYGVGFSIGPAGINLLALGSYAPFLTVAVFYTVVILLLQRLPDQKVRSEGKESPAQKRYGIAAKIAWFALIPTFLYGYTEAVLNSSFPLYGLRLGLSDTSVSMLLPLVGFGGLILQLPLGMLSDKIGRKPVLLAAAAMGAAAFLAVPFAGSSVWGIGLLLLTAGGMIGSFFSLGLAYAADLLPRELLPSANVIGSILFSIGSVVGPNLGGLGIQYISLSSLFFLLGSVYVLFVLTGLAVRTRKRGGADAGIGQA